MLVTTALGGWGGDSWILGVHWSVSLEEMEISVQQETLSQGNKSESNSGT